MTSVKLRLLLGLYWHFVMNFAENQIISDKSRSLQGYTSRVIHSSMKIVGV